MNTTPESIKEISDSSEPFSSWERGKPPAGWFSGPLGQEAADFYEKNGFFVLEPGLSEDETDSLIEDAARICRNEDGEIAGAEPASPDQSDDDVMRNTLCIHFPHKISDVMRKALSHPRIVQALTTTVGPNVKAMQSMLFFKAAGKPGQAWHQDEDFIPTRDRSLVGVWIALDDATVENGCLWVIPGSHQPGILWKLEWHGDRRFDCASESRGFPYTSADEVPVEVKKGSVVFFNGYTLHRSLPNRAKTGYRRALVNHYMRAESFLPWRYTENVSMAMQDFRDIVMVAGEDPYAWKGVADIQQPMVREAGEGGCINGLTKEPAKYHN